MMGRLMAPINSLISKIKCIAGSSPLCGKGRFPEPDTKRFCLNNNHTIMGISFGTCPNNPQKKTKNLDTFCLWGGIKKNSW